MALMIDKETKEAVPVTAFLNADRLAKDIARVNDAGAREVHDDGGSRFGAASQLLIQLPHQSTSRLSTF